MSVKKNKSVKKDFFHTGLDTRKLVKIRFFLNIPYLEMLCVELECYNVIFYGKMIYFPMFKAQNDQKLSISSLLRHMKFSVFANFPIDHN